MYLNSQLNYDFKIFLQMSDKTLSWTDQYHLILSKMLIVSSHQCLDWFHILLQPPLETF